MAYGRKVAFEAVREAAFGDIGAAYAALGTAVSDHVRMIRVVNTTDDDVYISLDGVNDHIRVPAGTADSNGVAQYDFTSNEVKDDGFFIAAGTQFYQKEAGSGPSAGNLWLEVVYGAGGI